MLKPALAIFWMVASCKLPLGNPKRNFFLLAIILLPGPPGPGAEINLRGFLDARDRIDLPSPARESAPFLLRFHASSRFNVSMTMRVTLCARSPAGPEPKSPRAQSPRCTPDTTLAPLPESARANSPACPRPAPARPAGR